MKRTDFEAQVAELEHQWKADKRWLGIRRDYSAESVVRLRGSMRIDLDPASVPTMAAS